MKRLSNQTIHGVFGNSESFGYYQFFLSYCDNETYHDENNNKCYDISYIEDTLEYTYLDFRFIDFGINNVYQNDVKSSFIRAETFSFSRTLYKRIWMFINKVKYIKDTGIIFKLLTEEYFYQFHSLRFDRDERSITDGIFTNTFGSLSVMGISKITVYHQRRTKIQEVLADLSGVTKFIYMCCFVINYYYSYNSYYFRLINEMETVITKHINKAKKNEITKGQSSFITQSLDDINNNNRLVKINTRSKGNISDHKFQNRTKKEEIKTENGVTSANNSEIQIFKINQGLKSRKNKSKNNVDWPFIHKFFPIGCCIVKKNKVNIFKQLFYETNKRFSITTIFKVQFWFEKYNKKNINSLSERLIQTIIPLRVSDLHSIPSILSKKSNNK